MRGDKTARADLTLGLGDVPLDRTRAGVPIPAKHTREDKKYHENDPVWELPQKIKNIQSIEPFHNGRILYLDAGSKEYTQEPILTLAFNTTSAMPQPLPHTA